jgi:polysaccharide export outer membrane protein
MAKTFLALAMGFIVFSQHAVLKAQDPAQGVHQAPSTSALPAPPTRPSRASISNEYLINANDILDVYVYDVPELSHSYTVSPSGVINMPLLATPLQAAGLTIDQLTRAMEEAFRQSGRLLRPEIAISVKPSPTSSVAVEGAVKNPLILAEIGRTRLIDVLTQCGGLADDAGTNATITRSPLALRSLVAEGGQAAPTLTIELKKVMDVTDPASTIEVWPGDHVSVERERPDVYYVLGEVKSPGGYTLRRGHEELTVLRALAVAGDATGVAKKSKAMIIRKDPKAPQGREEIKLDLKRILAGRSPDPVLQANDILFVPGSMGKKALHTIETAPAMIVGEAGAAAIVTH